VPEEPNIICVLDDDASILKAMRRLLASAGLTMVGFSDPRLFLEYAKTHAIGLAILDVWMPELSGLEVQSRLRDFGLPTPVIIITGRDETGIRSLGLQQGAAAVFTKPFNDDALLEAIRAALPAIG